MIVMIFSYSLFFLSFTPLWISILFVDILNIIQGDEHLCTEYIGMVCIILSLIFSLIVLFKELKSQCTEGTHLYTIVNVKEEKTITTEYLLSHILPLFTFDFKQWDGAILFLIFFITLGFLCIKHNNFYVNIVLEIAKYNFYSCTLINEDNVQINKIVISRRKLTGCIGDDIHLKLLNNELGLDILI